MAELEINSFVRTNFRTAREYEGDSLEFAAGLSSISSPSQWGYLVCGGNVEIKSGQDGSRISTVNFSYHIPSAYVTCCCESAFKEQNILIVGLDCASSVNSSPGMVCFINVDNSKILKTVSLDYVPSCIEEVKYDGGADAKQSVLSERLKLFFGVIAIGTVGGHIYLMDMTMDLIKYSAEEQSVSNACDIYRLEKADLPIHHRENAINADQVLAFDLSAPYCSPKAYQYTTAGGKAIGVFRSDEVAVTSMLYVESTGLLFVGLSLCCFQIWDLSLMMLIFSSQTVRDDCCVSHLAFQEPEDDPRHCCYLWVARGPASVDSTNTAPTVLSLYQLAFDVKENIADVGHVYKDLTQVCLQFEHQLTSDVHHLADSLSVGSRVISCQTVARQHLKDTTMLFVAWEAPSQDPQIRPTCHLGLFDLNKWYHQQMPSSIRDAMYGSKDPWCQFFTFYSLSDVTEPFSTDSFLDLKIDAQSVVRFKHVDSLLSIPEQYFWPSAVSFNCVGITRQGFVHIEVLGIQAKILADLVRDGCSCFDRALSIFNHAWIAGIVPKYLDISKSQEKLFYSEALLCIALEYDVLPFVCQCIDIWSSTNVSNSSVSLKLVLKWAWERVMQIKTQLDELHIPLFIEPSQLIHGDVKATLNTCSWQLNRLVAVMKKLSSSGVAVTDAAKQELAVKTLVTECIAKYSTVALDLVRCGLLPDRSGTKTSKSKRMVYDFEEVANQCRQRKESLNSVNQSSEWPVQGLFAENLTRELEDCIQENMFEEETEWDGVYPPTSINAMCKSFLIDMPESESRERIFLYWLLDLLEDADDKNEVIGSATSHSNLQPTDVLLVKAMRLLDCGQCQEAVDILVSPEVKLSPSECSSISRCLFVRGQSELALFMLAVGVRTSALVSVDAEFYIHLLIKHGRLMDAYNIEKTIDSCKASGLMPSFFRACLTYNRAEHLLDFPLQESELELLFHLLASDRSLASKDLLIALATYRRCHSKVGELQMMHPKLKDSKSSKNGFTQVVILRTFLRLLPKTQFDIATVEACNFVKRKNLHKQVDRPQALSALVKETAVSAPLSRSTVLFNAMESVDAANRVLQTEPGRRRSIPFMASPAVNHVRDCVPPSSLRHSKPSHSLKKPKDQRRRSATAPKSLDLLGRAKRESLCGDAAAIRLLRTPPSKRCVTNAMYCDRRPTSSRFQQTPSSILKSAKKVVSLGPDKRVEEQRKIRFVTSDSEEEDEPAQDAVATSSRSTRVGFAQPDSPPQSSHEKIEDKSSAGVSRSLAFSDVDGLAIDTEKEDTSDAATDKPIQMTKDSTIELVEDDVIRQSRADDIKAEQDDMEVPSIVVDSPDTHSADISFASADDTLFERDQDMTHSESAVIEAPTSDQQFLDKDHDLDVSQISHAHSASFTAIDALSESIPLCAYVDGGDAADIEYQLPPENDVSLGVGPDESTFDEPTFDGDSLSGDTTVGDLTTDTVIEVDERDKEVHSSPTKKPRRQPRTKKTDGLALPRVLRSATKKEHRRDLSVESQSPLSFDVKKSNKSKSDSTMDQTTPSARRRGRPPKETPTTAPRTRRSIASESPRTHRMTLRTRLTK